MEPEATLTRQLTNWLNWKLLSQNQYQNQTNSPGVSMGLLVTTSE